MYQSFRHRKAKTHAPHELIEGNTQSHDIICDSVATELQ